MLSPGASSRRMGAESDRALNLRPLEFNGQRATGDRTVNQCDGRSTGRQATVSSAEQVTGYRLQAGGCVRKVRQVLGGPKGRGGGLSSNMLNRGDPKPSQVAKRRIA